MGFLPVQGLVLNAFSHAESDKIVQIFTLQEGKVRAISKGARKPRSRQASALEPFTESTFSLNRRTGGDLFVISQARILDDYHDLKGDLATIVLLQLLADILLQSLPDQDPNRDLYILLKAMLSAFREHPGSREQTLAAFCLHYLALSGYPLELNDCAECGELLVKKEVFLIPHRGGALCGNCCPSGPARLRVDPRELEVMKRLRSQPLERAHILRMASAYTRKMLLTLLEYLESTVGKKLKSVAFYLKIVEA